MKIIKHKVIQNMKNIYLIPSKTKQETLKEACERLLNLNEYDRFRDFYYIQELQKAFKLGVEWQAEQFKKK